MGKIHYSYKPDRSQKIARARGDMIRVHFKNTVETCNAIKGKTLHDARAFLIDVVKHKQAVPFKKFNGGPSRHRQALGSGTNQCRWPTKSVFAVLKLLKNAEANATKNNMDKKRLYISHIQANRAPRIRRRTFRAHGRINGMLSSPSHIELVLEEKKVETSAPEDKQQVVTAE